MADDPFLAAMEEFVAKSKAGLDLTVQAIAQDSLAYIKSVTPVRTGNLRANWTLVLGSETLPVAYGGDRGANSDEAVLKLRAGDYFSLVNPLVYAMRVNYGFVGQDSAGRSFDQGGAHMIEQTITALPRIAAAAVARVNGG